jgi:TP901 family phage tail tape measure protein
LLGGGAIATGGIRTLASYQQTMSTVKAVTQATGDQFAALSEESKRLGATTRFSATQAGEGMEFLGRAGFTAAEILESTEGTLRLAQVGQLSLARAADISSNALQAFRLPAREMGRVVDVMAKTVISANTNVEQLGDALKLSAPVAAAFGVEIEETSAAIGALSNAGLQATLAGTGLRKIMLDLANPSGEMVDTLRNLGLEASDVDIKVVGLSTAMERLAEAGAKGLGGKLFGTRGGPAFEVLLAAISGGEVDEFTKQLLQAAGTAKEVADIMDQNLNGALLAVKSRWEALLLALGDLDKNNKLTQAVHNVADGLAFMAENAGTLVAAMKTLGATIAAGVVAKALIPYTAGMSVAGGATLAFSGIVEATTARITWMTAAMARNPFGLLLVGLTAVIGALTFFRHDIKLTSDGMVTLGDVLNLAGEYLGWWGTQAGKIFADVAKWIGTITPALTSVANFLRSWVSMVIGFWTGVGSAIASVIRDIVNEMTKLRKLGGNFVDIFSSLVEGDIGGTTSAFRNLVSGATDLGTDMGANAAAAFTEAFTTDWVGEIAGAIGSGLGIIGDAVDPFVQHVSDRLRERARAAQAEQRRKESAERARLTGPFLPGQEPEEFKNADPNADLHRIVDQLERELVGINLEMLDSQLRLNQAAAIEAEIMDSLRGPQEALLDRQRVLLENYDTLASEGIPVERELLALKQEQAALDLANAGTFDEALIAGFNSQLLDMQLNFLDFANMLNNTLGPDGTLIQGLSTALAKGILFGESMSEAMANLGKTIATELLSQLIKMGIQLALNWLLQEKLMKGGATGGADARIKDIAKVTAVSVAALAAVTVAGSAAATALATAWAPAAALASLATAGGNAEGAMAGIGATTALAESIAGVTALADGGLFRGSGGPRSDSNLARLSDGEFVVNAAATKQFLPLLEGINSGKSVAMSGGGDTTHISIGPPEIYVSGEGMNADEVAAAVSEIFTDRLEEELQFGGRLEKARKR